jgi:hypothetical protein
VTLVVEDAIVFEASTKKAIRLWRKAQGKHPRYLAWKAYDRLAKKSRRYTRRMRMRSFSEQRVARMFNLAPHTSLAKHLLNRTKPAFHLTQADISAVLERLCTQDPSYREHLLEHAQRIHHHRLDILSVGEVDLGERIWWNQDYRHNYSWPNQYAFDYNFLSIGSPSDVRIAWELNRLHFLFILGKAYRCTADEQHVRRFKEFVTDWDEHNPYEYSINWTCAMDVGIRAVNLIWSLMLVLPSSEIDDAFLLRVVRMLLQHGRYIRQNLEYSDIRGNHYLSDLVGLIYIGVFLPESKEAQGWLAYAVPRFEQEMTHQVYEDGVDHEGTIPYHRLVAELFLSTALLLRRNDIVLEDGFYDRLEKMLDFVQSYIKPDGQCPMFGDADDGRLHVFGDQAINDHRYLLSTGASVFDRADFKASAGTFWEESAWLLGPEGWARFDALPSLPMIPSSKAFPNGGFFFLRNATDYVAVDCGDVGLRSTGGHGHTDILSIEMVLGGENIVVDRGCALYTVSPEVRRDVIAASSHNTIIVDNHDYARVFDYDIASVRNTPGKALAWLVTATQSIFEGEHYGYADQGIVHQRRIVLDHDHSAVVVQDTLTGGGCHAVVANFYLAPGCTATVDGARCTIRTAGGRVVAGVAAGAEDGRWTVETTSVYPRYGVAVESSLLRWHASLSLPATLTFDWSIV